MTSAGGVLALEGAVRGPHITRLAVYEPTYVIEGTRPRPGEDLAARLETLVDQGDRDGAVRLVLGWH